MTCLLLETQLTFHFILFPHLVKSAGLCRCKVEMGKGNDGLEGKSRQHAASQIQGEGKKSDRPGTAGWLQAGMSYRCHSFDSYVVKRVAGEWWGRILQWYLSLSLILFMELARTGDTRRGKNGTLFTTNGLRDDDSEFVGMQRPACFTSLLSCYLAEPQL